MQIAILLTVHNRKDTTLACLRNIAGMDYDKDRIACDIYMTDDGCTDGTSDAVSKEFPQVRIIKGDGSLFWNRGMYAAWEEAAKIDYDFFWWVNDDTMVFKDTLKKLIDCSRAHDDQSIIVGSTIASAADGAVTYGGYVNGKLVHDIGESHKCDTFNGNLVMIPKSVFAFLGMNDPYYRHSLGDWDYGLRASISKISIWTAPGACGICNKHDKPTVWMDPSKSFQKRWKNFFSPLGNNPFEFFHFNRKHFGFLTATLKFISNFVHFLFPRLWKRSYTSLS